MVRHSGLHLLAFFFTKGGLEDSVELSFIYHVAGTNYKEVQNKTRPKEQNI
jgi:hypothetical protein